MGFEGIEKLIAAIGTALAALLTPIGVIYVASLSRNNKSIEESISTLTEELSRTRKRLEDAEIQSHKEQAFGAQWYGLMMVWFNQAHDMRRHALDARQVAESYARLNPSLPAPVWNASIELPTLNVNDVFQNPTNKGK